MTEKTYCTDMCIHQKDCVCTLTQEERDKLTTCALSRNYDYMAKYNHSINEWAELHGEEVNEYDGE